MGTLYRNGVPFVGSGGAGGVEVTQAEYDALPTSEKMNGAIYFITDGDVSYPTASQMRYDNTTSQIPSTTVQGAIDENRIEINSLKTGLNKGLKESLVFTAESKADFLRQILDTVRTYPVGQYVMGIRRNGYYFCLVMVAIQNSDRVNVEAVPQVGNLNEILFGTYNNGSYIYSKVTTTSFTVD